LGTTVVSPTIASPSGVSSKTVNVWRSGNVVTIALGVTLNATLSDWVTLISGIPAPKYLFHTTMSDFESSFKRHLRVLVGTGGELKLRYGASGEYNTVITYVCV
jgi:hypothetical protein